MKVVLTYSGGLDSTVLLYHLLQQRHQVRCLSVNYGQRHRKELLVAERICSKLGVEHRVADLSNLLPFLGGSSQTSPELAVPEGHYAEESMKLTVVPNRNMLLLGVAAAWAISTRSEAIAYAAHGGDHAIYPDCRPEFTEVMERAFLLCDWHPVQLLRPFLNPVIMDKTAIVKLGAELRVPFAETWSCYKGGEFHCGKCGTDVERKEAFQLAGVPDPTEYR